MIGVFSYVKEEDRVMEDLGTRSAQEVLDDHLNLAENWGGEGGFERILEGDIRRNLSEDIVILINPDTVVEEVDSVEAERARAALLDERRREYAELLTRIRASNPEYASLVSVAPARQISSTLR